MQAVRVLPFAHLEKLVLFYFVINECLFIFCLFCFVLVFFLTGLDMEFTGLYSAVPQNNQPR